MANIKFKLGFDLDKKGIQEAKGQLQQLMNTIKSSDKFSVDKDLQRAYKSAELLDKALKKTFSNDLGKLNVKQFNKELNSGRRSLSAIEKDLNKVGVRGAQAFGAIEYEIDKVGLQVRQTSKLLNNMFDTFGKTVKWGIASSLMNQMSGSVQRAVGFTKALDESLNNIRVVSGKNTSQMKEFAEQANDAARALGKTTTEYTDASLIFFQQGKAANEVKSLTEATLMGANVTGTEVSQMADLLTAVMNGYNIEAGRALEITDKLAAVGAATGSDFEELATGMSKVASMANIAGVDIDRLNAMLATTTTVTREAPESIGTSFKTIFGRIAEVKAGKEDEEGWDLGKVEDTFKKAGMSVLDAQGKMKDVGVIIEEVGGKWAGFNRETQMALANAMAGQRQANRLIALFQNWDMYLETVNTSQESLGATMEQNAIREDSLAYKSKQLSASLESLWMNIFSEDALSTGISLLDGLVSSVDNMITSIGGIGKALLAMGAIAVSVFSKQVAGSLVGAQDRFGSFKEDIKRSKVVGSVSRAVSSVTRADNENEEPTFARSYELEQQQQARHMADAELKVKKNLTTEEHARYKALTQTVNKEAEARTLAQKKLAIAKDLVAQAGLEGKEITKANMKDTKKGVVSEKVELEKLKNDTKSLVTAENQRTISKKKLIELTRNESKMVQDVVKEATKGKGKNVEIEKVQQRINKAIQERVEQLRIVNQLEKDGLSNIEGEANALETRSEEEVNARNELEQIENAANRQQRMQNLVSAATFATMAVTGLTGAFRAYQDAGADVEKQNDAIVAGTNSIGMSLMMLPHPLAKLGGAFAMVGGQIFKFVKENFGMGGVLKRNRENLEQYRKSLQELNETQKNAKEALGKMNRLDELEVGGLANDELQEYQSIVKEIADSAPEVVDYYDAFGNAVLKTRKEVDDLIASLEKKKKLQHEKMESQGDSYALEMAYLSTQAQVDKEAAEKEIIRLNKKLEEKYESGHSTEGVLKDLEKQQTKLNEIQTKYDEIGKSTQEAIVNPFIQSNDIFKDLGKEFQGYTTSLFNVQTIQEKSNEIARMGITDIGTVKSMTEEYLEEYKKGVLEVANAFDIIYKDQSKNGIALRKELEGYSEETKKAIGEISLTLTPFMDEKQIASEVGKLTTFIDENGKINAFGFMNHLKGIGDTARDELIRGFREASDEFEEIMNKTQEGSFKSNFTQLEEEVNNSNNIRMSGRSDEIYNALEEYKAGNVKILEELYTGDAEIRALIDEQVQDLSTDSIFRTDAENKAGNELREILDKLLESKTAVDAVNESFGETNVLVDNYAAKLAQTVEGQEFIVEAWNKMVSITEEVGEDGLFSVDLIELDEQREILEETAESTEAYAKAADEAGVSTEKLEKHAEKIGAAFEDILADSNLSKTFQELNGMTDDQMKNIRNLTNEAKKGNIDAAKSLQSEMGKVYATMYAQDTTYYRNFIKNNRDRLNDVALVTGLEADQYSNLADYQNALQGFITRVGGQENFNRLVDLQSYLGAQVQGMGDAANETVKINGIAMNANQRAAGIIALEAAKASVIAAQKGGEGGSEAAANMISALSAVDSAVGTSLAGMAEELRNKGENYNSIIDMINAEIAKIAAGGEGSGDDLSTKIPVDFKPKPINYKPPGGNISAPGKPSKPSGAGSGDKGPGVGGGGGGKDKDKGGKKDKEEKEVEDLEWEEDIYHDINIQLEKKAQLLDRLKKEQDKLYGKELLDNLNKQKKALQEQQKLLEKKLEMQKKDLDNQKKDLASKGVTFDAEGTISNYNQLLKAKMEAVNKLSGEAKEKAKEEFQALVEMMEAYEEMMMNTITETENAIQDSIDAQREIFLQEFDYTINVQLELTGDFDKAIDFQKDFFDGYEDSAENYDRTMDQLDNKIGEIQAIQEQIDKVKNDETLSDKERLERLDDLSDKLKSSTLDAKKLSEELTKIYTDTLKEGLDIVKEHTDEYKRMNEEIKHLQQMMKLLGQGLDYDALDELYEAQYQNLQGQINVLAKQKNVLEAQRDALEAAGLKGSDEWEAVNKAINDTQKELDKLAQDTLKVLQDEFKNSVDSILDDLDKALSGGKGLDKLKKEHDELKEKRKEYLDIEEKITEVGKLQSKINKDMAGITDPKKLETLQKFKDKELAALKEKDKLTKYDIDRANLMYDITLKQMALEEQKNAKNLMRLVRDSAGNWVYEFVQDNEAVEKAREELSDSLEKLQELDKKQFEKAQEDMIKAKLDFEKEIKSIIEKQMKGEYESEEAFKTALEEAQNKYNEKMKEKSEALNQAQINGTQSSLATILQAYMENTEGLGLLAGEQEEMMKALATAIGGDFTMLKDVLAALNSENSEDFKNMAEQMGLDEALLRETLLGITGQIKEDWGGSITDMIGDIGNLDISSDTAIQSIMDKWKEYQEKVDEVTNATSNNLTDIKDRIENISQATNDLNEDTDKLIGKFHEEMKQINAVVAANASLKKSYDDITTSVAKQIKELDDLIRKQKEAATGVNKPTGGKPPSTGGGSGGSGGGGGTKPPTTKPPTSSGGGSGGSSGKTPSYTKGEFVTVKNDTLYYETSKGQKRRGNAKKGTKYQIDDPKVYKPMSGATKNIHISNASGGDLGWLNKNELVKFKSGGYTGAFGNEVIDGKLAVLHEKELVLNKEDTKNMLDAVKVLRGTGKSSLADIFSFTIKASTNAIVSAIDRAGKMATLGNFSGNTNSGSETIKQNVSINADFSGVKNSGEIEKAFDSLVIQASQYASKKK